METTIGGVGHSTLQARSRHVSAIVTLAGTRNVNPRADNLIFERFALTEDTVWENRNRDQSDGIKTAPIHKRPPISSTSNTRGIRCPLWVVVSTDQRTTF